MNILEIARKAGAKHGIENEADTEFLERFSALIREAVVQELVSESGAPKFHEDYGPHGNHFSYYTADQIAGAVLRERERCAKLEAQNVHLRNTRQEFQEVSMTLVRERDRAISRIAKLEAALDVALESLENSRGLEPVDEQWVKGQRKAAIAKIKEVRK